MPLDPTQLATMSAASQMGSSALGNMMNMMNQNATNFANQAFSVRMYDKQRADALADWHMQNEYNSPANVRKRLEAANVNPALYYGGGAGSVTASQPRQSSPGPTPNQAPQVDFSGIGNAFMSFASVMKTMADTDRIKELSKLAQIQQLNTAVGAAKADAETKKIYQEIDFKDQINPLTLEKLSADIDNVDIRNYTMLSKDARETLLASQSLEIGFQKIKNMVAELGRTEAQKDEIRKRIQLMEKDGSLKDLDINLKQMGIQPGDPLWMRAVAQAIQWLLKNPPSETINSVINPFEKLFQDVKRNR